jgi:hypothetical protein
LVLQKGKAELVKILLVWDYKKLQKLTKSCQFFFGKFAKAFHLKISEFCIQFVKWFWQIATIKNLQLWLLQGTPAFWLTINVFLIAYRNCGHNIDNPINPGGFNNVPLLGDKGQIPRSPELRQHPTEGPLSPPCRSRGGHSSAGRHVQMLGL